MRRRALLATVGAGTAAGLAGCVDIEQERVDLEADALSNCLDRELDDESYAAGRETNDDVLLAVDNLTTEEWTVDVRLDHDGETIVDTTVTAESTEFLIVVDGEITTTGDYDLSANVDGGDSVEATWRVCRNSFVLAVTVDEGGEIGFQKPGREFED